MMTSMFVGGTLFPVREFSRREVLDLVTRERLTYFGAVPSHLRDPRRHPASAATSTSRACGRSSRRARRSLPADNRRFREKYGHWIRQLYGSTETGTISVNLDADVEGSLASVGRPLPDVRFEVVDEPAAPIAAGAEGEVRIASPAPITGYDGNPEANASRLPRRLVLVGRSRPA